MKKTEEREIQIVREIRLLEARIRNTPQVQTQATQLGNERDILRGVADDVDPDISLAADFMTPAPDTFAPDVDVEEAAAWLIETGYRHLPVMRDGELLGIASIRDLLWAMVEGD